MEGAWITWVSLAKVSQLQLYDGGCRSLKLKGRLQSEQSPKRAGWSVRLGSRV